MAGREKLKFAIPGKENSEDLSAAKVNEADFGAYLREVRLHREMELSDVAAQLKIRLIHLEAIEEGRFEDLPGTTYTNKMHAVNSSHLFDHELVPASSRQRSVIRFSASGFAKLRAFMARAFNSSRLISHFFKRSASDSSQRSASAIITAAPASTIGFALAV